MTLNKYKIEILHYIFINYFYICKIWRQKKPLRFTWQQLQQLLLIYLVLLASCLVLLSFLQIQQLHLWNVCCIVLSYELFPLQPRKKIQWKTNRRIKKKDVRTFIWKHLNKVRTFFDFSCLGTLGVWFLTLPARAKDPWTYSIVDVKVRGEG